VEEIDMDDLRLVMETMFFGAVGLTEAVVPYMRERDSGVIVQIISQGGQMSFAGGGAYSAAKFALEGLSEALADEVRPHGIRVLIVEPGAFRTELMGARFNVRARSTRTQAPWGVRAYLESANGTQAGDPRKAAKAILAAVDASDPPLRLALGADAVRRHSTTCRIVAPGRADDFASAFTGMQATARKEEGCEQYELFQSLDEPEKLVLLERWASQELLDKHMEAERTRNRSAVDALVALWAPGITPTIERFDV
jgi:quinol monooxygenase YgiN